MKFIHSIADLRRERQNLPAPVGLVPTMGFLHEGHLSLVRAARAECASVVVSIFVNPTQFGPSEDLAAYPRDLPRDLDLLAQTGADFVWAPTAEEMYPPDFQTWISVEKVALPLEGAMRPGHFRGVATIVAKLFNTVQPDRAYFGQKDAQQAAVIRRMVKDLNFPVDIVICPIVREPGGLAMSSRNTYLSPAERQAAAVINRALRTAEAAYLAGERTAERLRQLMAGTIAAEPAARLQYASCADLDSLEEIEGLLSRPALLSMAVYFGKTRLIDNLILSS